MSQPNVLFIMTDQQRFDTIAALGNEHIHTPNLDRLVRRGLALTRAYSTCPVCVPARYTIRTGCTSPTTRYFGNGGSPPAQGQAPTMQGRCGPYLAAAMRQAGYRTFGIGKFHSQPRFEDLGYDVHLHSEETYYAREHVQGDAYRSWIAREHPAFDYLEQVMGERTEMYYMPQTSPLPPELTVEWWAADRAVEQIADDDERPYFGLVSFIGPHPPFAPPIPFNRMYDPDRMPDPVAGEAASDRADPFLEFSNYTMYADEISPHRARCLKARYYGEISYIDHCLGRILDAVDARPDADNTLIAFFSDHGDHLGDHGAWQKESFFDAACRIPMLVSWPNRLPAGQRRDDLACLADLFGLATSAAGQADLREGIDLLGMLDGRTAGRGHLVGMYGRPGTHEFKMMVRTDRWKYLYIANGGRELLFDHQADPLERTDVSQGHADEVERLRELAFEACRGPGAAEALEGDRLRSFPRQPHAERRRCRQFDRSRGITDWPQSPGQVLEGFAFNPPRRPGPS